MTARLCEVIPADVGITVRDETRHLAPPPQPPREVRVRVRVRVGVRVRDRVGVRVRDRDRVGVRVTPRPARASHLESECSSCTPPSFPPTFLEEPLYGASTQPQQRVCILPSSGPLSHLGSGRG